MAIITQTPTPQTDAEKLAAVVALQQQQFNQVYRQLISLATNAAKFVWENPKYTPQEIFDAYGTNAGDLCKLSSCLFAFVEAYTGNTVKVVPDGYSLTGNADGTITVEKTQTE